MAKAPSSTPLLQQRPFRMLSYARFFARVPQNALNFALVLLIADETGKAFLSALLVLALVLPSTVAGLASGAAADIFPKRLLVVFGDLGRAAVCVLFVLGEGSVASYYLLAITLSVLNQVAGTAEGAILPAIVAREDLARANAIGHAVTGAAQLAGFVVLTPVMLRLFDNPDALFLVCAGFFLVAAFQAPLIGRVVSPSRREVGGDIPGRWWLVGWRQMRSDRAVMHAAVELTLISTALIILGGLIPKYIEDTLGLPVDVGAVVLTPAAIGVVLGLRIAGFLAHRVPHAALSSFGFTAFVVLLALLAFVNTEADFLAGYGAFAWLNDVEIGSFDRGALLAMLLVMPLGFAYAIVSVAAQTVMNDNVPLHLQGRVISTQGAMAALASSLPVLIAGAIADVVGVTAVMAVVAATTGFFAVANFREPRHRPAQALTV